VTFAQSFDQRIVKVKWAKGGKLVFISWNYSIDYRSDANPKLILSIPGVGSFNVEDNKKKFGVEGSNSVVIHDGLITSEMRSKLYAWSYTPYVTDEYNDTTEFYEKEIQNVLVLNWDLLKRVVTTSSLEFTVRATADINKYTIPPPDPKDNSWVWELGSIFVDELHVPIALYYPYTGDTTVDRYYSLAPSPFSGTFDECVAYVNAQSRPQDHVVGYYADPGPPSYKYDKYAFDVDVDAYYDANAAAVLFDDEEEEFYVEVPDPGVEGFNDVIGTGSDSSGWGYEYADWTVTGKIDSDMKDGTLKLDPEDPEPEGG